MEQDIRTFGRVRGKKLSPRKQRLVDNLLPRLSPVQADSETGNDAVLEIGFGAGEHLLHLAEKSQSLRIIGAEPFINGIASLLSRMTQQSLEFRVESLDNIIKPEYRNIRIWPGDVRNLLTLVNFGFAKIYILHPDPWPKTRHEKRRLLSTEFLNQLAARLNPKGQIIIGTDHTDYFNWTLGQVKNSKLKIMNKDFFAPPEPGLDTRYQRKNKFGSEKTMYLVMGKSR